MRHMYVWTAHQINVQHLIVETFSTLNAPNNCRVSQTETRSVLYAVASSEEFGH